ncbi:type II toxin-antitoxin system RelE/ParE family toxin [Bradyrhizobium sp. sBnM-33]|uniref:type II toxin-antitoxin system RelE/ParE family toxin n=1 Tax=Bradyrhizobium sp. sBnM-33 TaxID=2831780 RepID=UPI001BCE7D05|nr:type II toxin-antitoxin system RelE/ParE family toxin [Bradyrhizobium sp. sBnM-33]WOH47624.1 type II toxin-antitoxin system RelE/ParE family toxin [Bradyrhizobium sp. sBnM-33]
MHTVAQTKSFDAAAKQAGLTEDEISDIVSYLAEHPEAGEEMVGTGGCRKLRFGGRGKGKRGGYRTITFYSGEIMPVFLITVFAKGEKATLTAKESAALKVLTKLIATEYEKKISSLEKRKVLAG